MTSIAEPEAEAKTKEEKLEQEVEDLRQELETAQAMVRKLQSHIHHEQVRTNSIIMTLRLQLHQSQRALNRQRVDSEKQLQEVISQLLFVEGKLKKEQKQIRVILSEKDKTIKKQKDEIRGLTAKNDKLLFAISEIYSKGGGTVNGMLHDIENHEPPDSLDLSKDKDKVFKKTMFNSMKDKLRRHKSNLDLNDPDFQAPGHGLRNGRMFSSQENLSVSSSRAKQAKDRERCFSWAASYPIDLSDYALPESPDETEYKGDNSFEEGLNQDGGADFVFHITDTSLLTTNGMGREGGGMAHVKSMPMLAVQDGRFSSQKERPHSVSSIEQITMEQPDPAKSKSSSPKNSAPSESNPFKTIKTILKRKGSKMKNKKRSVSLPQSTNYEYQEALKKHFGKYDMS